MLWAALPTLARNGWIPTRTTPTRDTVNLIDLNDCVRWWRKHGHEREGWI